MLAQEQLDIVSVTTRPEERAEIVIATTESGGVKAIYATKPMCSSLAEADAMIGLVVNTGVILAIACHKNWSPWFQACLQAIAEGQIGSRPPCCVVSLMAVIPGLCFACLLARRLAGDRAPRRWWAPAGWHDSLPEWYSRFHNYWRLVQLRFRGQ